MSKLTAIKIIHTAIWIFFNVVFFYMVYAVIVRIDQYVWVGIALFSLEIIIMLIFKSQYSLTVIARRYSNSKKENFDILSPKLVG